jgi:thymidine kinase
MGTPIDLMNPTTIEAALRGPGTLEIIIGGMFSGKTSEMIRRLKRFKAINKSVIVINSAKDTRNPMEVLQTHDGVTFECVKTDYLVDVSLNADVIAVDEAQFFKGLRPFVERALAHGKKVILAGLDGDYRQQVFGELLPLIPLADHVIKLTALCMLCRDGTKGPFSKRLTSDTCQEVVGGESSYAAVCRRHILLP